MNVLAAYNSHKEVIGLTALGVAAAIVNFAIQIAKENDDIGSLSKKTVA